MKNPATPKEDIEAQVTRFRNHHAWAQDRLRAAYPNDMGKRMVEAGRAYVEECVRAIRASK